MELLTFCVIGGGPTGVELAGALSELSRHLVRRDFRHIRPDEISVMLVEGGSTVIGTFSEVSRARAQAQLEALHVEVRTGSRVVRIEREALTIVQPDSNELRIPASTILWAAGVSASALSASLGVPLDRARLRDRRRDTQRARLR